MPNVKGTILIDFVKTIKADSSGAYNAYLNDLDREILHQRLLPSGWYPYQTFKNCFNAVFKVLAKGDLEKVRQWGRVYGEAIITGVYKSIIKEGEPLESLMKYSTHIRNFFDFGEILVEPVEKDQALVRIRGFDPTFQPQYSIMQGWLERSLELCGAKNIRTEVIAATWKGAPETIVKITWQM